eukprot:620458-Lingulodinium_polyedra.AAC.1
MRGFNAVGNALRVQWGDKSIAVMFNNVRGQWFRMSGTKTHNVRALFIVIHIFHVCVRGQGGYAEF